MKKSNQNKRYAITIMLFILGMNNYLLTYYAFNWFGLVVSLPIGYYIGKTNGELIE